MQGGAVQFERDCLIASFAIRCLFILLFFSSFIHTIFFIFAWRKGSAFDLNVAIANGCMLFSCYQTTFMNLISISSPKHCYNSFSHSLFPFLYNFVSMTESVLDFLFRFRLLQLTIPQT